MGHDMGREVESYADIHHGKIARENRRVGEEWAALNLPAWDDMTKEQQGIAVQLAERQGIRSKKVDEWWRSITKEINHD